MKVYYHKGADFDLKGSVTTIGSFDGVHVGHKKIISELVALARAQQLESTIITFLTHPKYILQPEKRNQMKLLTTFEEKLPLFESFGVDNLLVLDFDMEMSKKTSEWFVENVLLAVCKTKILVLGYDHRFGNGREGGFDYLKTHQEKWGFELVEINRQDIENNAISSTKIRQLVSNSQFDQAEVFLGRPYSFKGLTIHGKKLGRTIGFPTANLFVHQDKLIPDTGVYVVQAKVGNDTLEGMMNVGFNPTIENKGFSVEVHLFDFQKDIYGEEVEVFPLRRIRAEKKFGSIEELISQLMEDKKVANTFFQSLKQQSSNSQ